MKKSLLIALILITLNYSCSKKDHNIVVAPPPPTVLVEYPIDLNFSINPICNISYDTASNYPPLNEKDFYFFASSVANLPDDTLGTYIEAQQNYGYYRQIYSDAILKISTKQQQNPFYTENELFVQPIHNFNFFTLPYQSGIASFSDTCYVISGSGKYKTVDKKIAPLIFSGFMNTANGTGNIRIKGSVFLQQ